MLGYKEHIPVHNTKMKVATRNNLLRKLSNSKWGANASTVRTTALALCYSVAEYAAPVWARSSHVQKLNPELNSACRAITGCLKPTNVEDLYLLAGIAPPDIRRDVCARVEKTKQETNEAHSLYGQNPAERRLKSRNCFLCSVKPADFVVVVVRLPRPMEGNGVTPIFKSLQNCQFHHRQLESLEHFNMLCVYIFVYSEHYDLSFLDLTDAIFASTLHVCYVFNVNLTDSFDDRWS